ncbi:MAG: TIGR01777 family oxidoreductase [Anaerolineae bacterium]|jgi:uncharacterized protein (TIGR01777 family)
MRVIITGGTGLIGRALSASLASDGHEVIVLSRRPQSAAWMPIGVDVVEWDARTANGWGKLANGADAIVNLAGAPLDRRWTPRYKGVIRDSRLNAGLAVVEAVEAVTSRPKVVIQAAGVSLYGPRGDEIITEGAEAADTFLGRTAVKWENSTAGVDRLGVRRAVVRSGVVLSLRGGAFPLMALPYRFFMGGPLGSGKQWLPWIHIEDEVRVIRFLIENEAANGPFNATAPGLVTNAEFSRILGRVIHRPALFRVPSFVLRLMLGEMSTVVLDGQRAVPRRLRDLGFTFAFPDLEKALYDLMD